MQEHSEAKERKGAKGKEDSQILAIEDKKGRSNEELKKKSSQDMTGDRRKLLKEGTKSKKDKTARNSLCLSINAPEILLSKESN